MARLGCAALVNAVDTLFHPRSLPTRQSADGPKSWQSYRMSTNMSRRLCEDELPLDSRPPDSAPPGLGSIDGWEVGYGIFATGCLIGALQLVTSWDSRDDTGAQREPGPSYQGGVRGMEEWVMADAGSDAKVL